jgi:hypothetical protein
LEEEEDETNDEEEAYGSVSPIPWEDLADEKELVGGDVSLVGPFPFHEREDMHSELIVAGHSTLSELFEQREGLKRPHADEP